MSVSILDENIISQIAHFGQKLGCGSAHLIGESLHKQNIAASNERYNGNQVACFELQDQDDITSPEHIYDMIGYLLSNSYTSSSNKDTFNLIGKIQANSAHPLTIHPIYSQTIGKRVSTRSHRFATTAFISDIISDTMMTVLYFESDTMEWRSINTLRSTYNFYPANENLFDLSTEQVEGITQTIKNKKLQKIKKRDEEQEAYNLKKKAFDESFAKVKPEGAKAVIIAELLENDCGHNDDYYGSITKRRVVLSFSNHTRRLFPEMRKAALNFKPTHELNKSDKDAEHRENYSMGKGTYLTIGSTYEGWSIRKEEINPKFSIDMAELLDINYSNTSKPVRNKKAASDLNSPLDEIKTNNSKTCNTVTQKMSHTFELQHGSITIDKNDKSITLVTRSEISPTDRRTLQSANLTSSDNGKSWSGCFSNEAMAAVRSVAVGVQCSLF